MIPQTENSYLSTLLDQRWSRRSFSDQPLTGKEIGEIFDAGRQVASCYNEQPWRIILAGKEDNHYQDLFDCLVEFNQKWCKTAPCLAVALGKLKFDKNGKENRHAFHDVGAFLSVASLRAMELGIYTHEMAGFSADKVREKLNIPDGYEPITMFTLGRPGNEDELPQQIAEKENPNSSRNGINTFLFSGEWGDPYLNR